MGRSPQLQRSDSFPVESSVALQINIAMRVANTIVTIKFLFAILIPNFPKDGLAFSMKKRASLDLS